MSAFGNREIIIKYDELPKFNGIYIKQIYRTYFDTSGVKRVSPPENERFYYYTLIPYFNITRNADKPIHTNKLPKDFEQFFENYNRIEGGKEIKINNLWYRTSDSGNGSFIDHSIYCDYSSKSFCVRRNAKDDFHIARNELPFAKKLFATLKKNYVVEELQEHQYTYYPSVVLRKIIGLNFPDMIESGWRRDHLMPYVTYDNPEYEYGIFKKNPKNVRVFNENNEVIVYLSQVSMDDIDKDGIEEYVHVTFDSRDSYNNYPTLPNSDYFCNIKSWAHFKKDTPNQMIRYRFKNETNSNDSVMCEIIGMESIRHKYANVGLSNLYRISRITPL